MTGTNAKVEVVRSSDFIGPKGPSWEAVGATVSSLSGPVEVVTLHLDFGTAAVIAEALAKDGDALAKRIAKSAPKVPQGLRLTLSTFRRIEKEIVAGLPEDVRRELGLTVDE